MKLRTSCHSFLTEKAKKNSKRVIIASLTEFSIRISFFSFFICSKTLDWELKIDFLLLLHKNKGKYFKLSINGKKLHKMSSDKREFRMFHKETSQNLTHKFF